MKNSYAEICMYFFPFSYNNLPHWKTVACLFIVVYNTVHLKYIYFLTHCNFIPRCPWNVFSVDSRGEMEEGSVRCRRGELTLWGCSKLDFIDGSRAFRIVIIAVQVLFEQLIVTAYHRQKQCLYSHAYWVMVANVLKSLFLQSFILEAAILLTLMWSYHQKSENKKETWLIWQDQAIWHPEKLMSLLSARSTTPVTISHWSRAALRLICC